MPPEETNHSESARQTVTRSHGITASEQYLKHLCDHSFLSLWSYPGVFRDEGCIAGKGDGKEVCDLLVVFENHVLIFSDKHIHFENTKDIKVGWRRWFKKAVVKSAQQVWGAERWIQQFPNRLFLDKSCRIPFPLMLPDPTTAVFHRIVVAHDASRVCQELMGGSGSLMLDTFVVGEEHLNRPFVIGRIDARKGYVHVFDDTSLDVVMRTLDTISDFVAYLTKKERLLTTGVKVVASGEEDLLAEYVAEVNSDGEHDFIFPKDIDAVWIPEGKWAAFLDSEERKAQIKANRVSYAWDSLVETFLGHLMSGTQYQTSDADISEQEQSFRWLARENRTRRRMLAKMIRGLLDNTPTTHRASRVVKPSRDGDPYYVFLLLPRHPKVEEKDYRAVRAHLLGEYCQVVKFHYPDARHIIGIATETLDGTDYRSEDFFHLDATEWNDDFDTLVWPHFDHLIWPHPKHRDRPSLVCVQDGEADGQETQGGAIRRDPARTWVWCRNGAVGSEEARNTSSNRAPSIGQCGTARAQSTTPGPASIGAGEGVH